jgi:hypothetical protein
MNSERLLQQNRPGADSRSATGGHCLFDQLVGDGEQVRRHFDAERLGDLLIDASAKKRPRNPLLAGLLLSDK